MLDPVTVEKTVAAKGTKFATVTFEKANGEKRTLNGLFKPASHILGTGKPTPPHLVAIWSPRDGWRSFRKSHVIEIR